MGNAPSKGGRPHRPARQNGDSAEREQDGAAQVTRPTLEGRMPAKQQQQLPPPPPPPQPQHQQQQQPSANGSPMPSAPGTPYTPGSVAGVGGRSGDYFPLQVTGTRESRMTLGGRMRGRKKKGSTAEPTEDGGRAGAGATTPRSYCDLPGAPILTGSAGTPQAGERLPPLRDGQGVALTEYLSVNGAEHAIIRHAEKPKQFSVDDMLFRLLEAGFSGRVTKSVCLRNSEIVAVCHAAREVFLAQPTLLQLAAPVKITGDIHGQYTDLLRLFDKCGYPPHCNYLFLGDYVDRGKQSIETMLLLMCFKIKYPDNFFLLRGNHECASVTRVYGFYDECKRRCNVKVWKAFINTFNALPVAAVVANKIFCVHGGLSPDLLSMSQIQQLSRPCDVPDHGILNDLLWSDPSDTAADWEDNERGVSYCFGKSVITEFLRRMDFDLICRAHMVVEDGYEFFHGRQLVTVFSAPNYCGEFDNSGAVMNVNEELLCSFEILKPVAENLTTCMARVEASFWSRRQQVEAMLNEAIATQAKRELDESAAPTSAPPMSAPPAAGAEAPVTALLSAPLPPPQQMKDQQGQRPATNAEPRVSGASPPPPPTAGSNNNAVGKPLSSSSSSSVADMGDVATVMGVPGRPAPRTRFPAGTGAPKPAPIAIVRKGSAAGVQMRRKQQRVVDRLELTDSLGSYNEDDDEDDDDEDDDDDDEEADGESGRLPVSPQSVLHGTPPRGSKLKHYPGASDDHGGD